MNHRVFLRPTSWIALAGVAAYLAVATYGCGSGEVGEPYLFGPPACDASSTESLMGCVDGARLEETLRFLAQERPPGSPGHTAVQDYCAEQFEALGMEVERHEYGTGVNVIGIKPGSSPDRVLLSAHYDHVEGCPGADDNASGVAGVIEAARVLAGQAHERTLVAACWDEEEFGLVGSRAYADRAADIGEPIAFHVVLEMIGYRSDEPMTQEVPPALGLVFPDAVDEIENNKSRADFILTVSDPASEPALEAFLVAADVAAVPVVSLRLTVAQTTSDLFGDLRRSDHAPFWDQGYPSMMVTDSANFRNKNYHCFDGGFDSIETIDFEFATQLTQAAVGTVAPLLNPQ